MLSLALEKINPKPKVVTVHFTQHCSYKIALENDILASQMHYEHMDAYLISPLFSFAYFNS